MTKLIDFLTPLENFQYSVNLEYDLNDDQKISSFIPTGSALEIIEEILLSTNVNSKDRARLLMGAYGKGKSHLALSILGMLAGKDKKLFMRIIEKASEVNPRIAANIEQYFESNTKLLPVLLNSQSIELRATLLQGLNKSLKRAGLDDLMPTTFFEAAIEKIESWRTEYPKTYKAFSEKVDSVAATIKKLKAYDNAEYNYFTQVYPTLTSGSEFNPLQSAEVINILDSVVDAIKSKGYNGIFIVYDEFSKFLDGNVETGSAQNVKLLQELAERCNRSGAKQVHLLLISHKNIENYVGSLPKKIVDDWKGISKRFKPLAIESSVAELFEMIASVLKKDEKKFKAFIKETSPSGESHADKFKQFKKLIDSSDIQSANKRSAFTDVIKHTGVDFVEKCYPLHPYALLLLPKISELVAQNERTIFTFLASDEKYAVKHFIRTNKSSFPLIEPDQIYDYFEQQFKNEPHGTEIRRQWQITASALGKIAQEENILAAKIIKSITLLYIVNQFDILPPSLDLVCEMYSAYSISEVNAAIEVIRQSGLFIELEFKPHVRIREISGNNADELVDAEIERISAGLNIRTELKKNLPSRYMYPVAYNDKYEITRFFAISFLDSKILKGINDINEFISAEESKADGYIYAVIINDEYEHEEGVRELKRLKGNRVVFALPKIPMDISRSVVRYTAIQNVLRKEKSLTPSTIDELEYIKGDLRELIDNYIDTHFFSPEQKKTDYYYDGTQVIVSRRTGLLSLLSDICDKVFGNTPVIINENINREILSAPMRATRVRILESLLKSVIPDYFGFAHKAIVKHGDEEKEVTKIDSSQDLNVARSIFLVPRIISDIEKPKIKTTGLDDANFENMFALIGMFIKKAMLEDVKFSELYSVLKDSDAGLALRSGVIPFYIAAALHPYKSQVVIKQRNREKQLTAEIFEAINERPDEYTMHIENWDDDKIIYIAGIEKAIIRYVNNDEKEYSSFNYIVVALQKWFLHLTRFDRETKRICDGAEYRPLSKFEAELKKQLSSPEINAHEFLFGRLPKMAESKSFTTISKKFQDAIKAIENNSRNVISKSAVDIKNLFARNGDASLCSVLQDYYESLSERTKRQVFSGLPAALLEVIRQRNIDDGKAVQSLVKGLIGLRLEDFNDGHIDRILPTVKDAKEAVDNFNKEARDIVMGNDSGYEITFIGADGKQDKKHISASTKLPTHARTFANEIETLIDEAGESMTTAEKAQVILEVLKKLFK